MDKNPISPNSFLSLYDHEYPPVSDDELKRFHTIDRKLYGKLINILGRDLAESMKVMAFFYWIEGVAKDRSFVAKLYDLTPPLLNKVVDEALICVKCTEDDLFSRYDSPDVFLIPNLLKQNFTIKYFQENRETAFQGITDALKTVCFRAFDDIHVVKQPSHFTRASLVPTTNAMTTDFTRASLVPTTNVMNIDQEMRRVPTINNPTPYAPIGGGGFLEESMRPSENMIEGVGTLSSRMMSPIHPNHFLGGASNIEELGRAANRMVLMNPSHVPGVGALHIEELGRAGNRIVPMNPSHVPMVPMNPSHVPMVPMNPSHVPMVPMNPSHVLGEGVLNIEELGRAGNRMVPMNPSHVQDVGGLNIEEFARAGNRMVPMNPSHVTGVGELNIEELARAGNRMVPVNPNLVAGVGSGVGASNIGELAREATRMVPMNPSRVRGMGAGGKIHLRWPCIVPTMPPYHGGSAMNLLPPPTPHNAHNFSHASSSGSGVFLPQMLPGGAQDPNIDLAEMLNNLNIFNVVTEENDTSPEDRTVFLTFSKGYPICEAEVKDFFTRKFGEDVLAVYMQEVPEDEQALYARLVTRSPALLEAIVEGGKAKYNINGKHVWARKYIKKQNPKVMFVGQSSSSVPSTSH